MPAKKKTKKKQTKPKPKSKAKPKVKLKAKPKTKPKVKPRKKKVAAKRRSGPSEFAMRKPESHPRNLSGDLQGLSRKEGAESESVAELLEEGNTFEAEVLSGVEAADSEEREVETHEVPEDDVPGEYLDED